MYPLKVNKTTQKEYFSTNNLDLSDINGAKRAKNMANDAFELLITIKQMVLFAFIKQKTKS